MLNKNRKQQGSALVISLLILLVLTIIGVTALNSTVMEEQMSSNFQTGNTAYQAAESAVNRAFTMIATDGMGTLVDQAMAAAPANQNPPTIPAITMTGSSAGADPNAANQTTISATVTYHGPGMAEGCGGMICTAHVVRVAGTGTVNNTNVSRTHFLGVKKNFPAPAP